MLHQRVRGREHWSSRQRLPGCSVPLLFCGPILFLSLSGSGGGSISVTGTVNRSFPGLTSGGSPDRDFERKRVRRGRSFGFLPSSAVSAGVGPLAGVGCDVFTLDFRRVSVRGCTGRSWPGPGLPRGCGGAGVSRTGSASGGVCLRYRRRAFDLAALAGSMAQLLGRRVTRSPPWPGVPADRVLCEAVYMYEKCRILMKKMSQHSAVTCSHPFIFKYSFSFLSSCDAFERYY